MFENEGSEIESTESDVIEDPSSGDQIESPPEAQEEAPAAQKEVPFHEHPRWKEVMEERNTERQARAQLEAQLQSMQKQFEAAQRPKDTRPDFKEISSKMQERLKGIDPEFQGYMSALEEQALSAKQELASFREEQFVNSALGKISAARSNLSPRQNPQHGRCGKGLQTGLRAAQQNDRSA